MAWLKKFDKVFLSLVAVIVFGIVGYMVIEGWSFLDALFMTVLTFSTVGYKEVQPLSTAGTIFTVVLIIVGVGIFLFVISSIGEYIVAGHLAGALGRRKMKKRIDALNNHYIICGFGQVGQQVARELSREDVPFVVIDISPEAIKQCASLEYLYVEGDASNDEVLKEAGILKAKGLIVATDTDADNVYIILSAKSIRQGLLIVARANNEGAEHKLLRAGANRVTSPNSIGGRRLASMLMRPAVVEFLDVVMHSAEVELLMEEVAIHKDSSFIGITLADARAKCAAGANILAVKKASERRAPPHHSVDTEIEKGDKLVALGTSEQLKELEVIS
ncbi:MAG: potassium channel protein [Thermodesulfobacteriota bacterium]